MRSTFYPVQGEPREIRPGHGNTFRLNELRGLIGSDFEIACSFDDGSSLFVSQTGRRVGMPINIRATELYRTRVASDDYICGPAVVVILRHQTK